MKTFLLTVVVLAVSAHGAPANKAKRDILPGDSRFGTDYHLQHHHVHSSAQTSDLNQYLPPTASQNTIIQNTVSQASSQNFEPPSTNYGVPFKIAEVQQPAVQVQTTSNQYIAPAVSSVASAPSTSYGTAVKQVEFAPQTTVQQVAAPAVEVKTEVAAAPVVPHTTYGVPNVQTQQVQTQQVQAVQQPAQIQKTIQVEAVQQPAQIQQVHHVEHQVETVQQPAQIQQVQHVQHQVETVQQPAQIQQVHQVQHQVEAVQQPAPVQQVHYVQQQVQQPAPIYGAPVQQVHHEVQQVHHQIQEVHQPAPVEVQHFHQPAPAPVQHFHQPASIRFQEVHHQPAPIRFQEVHHQPAPVHVQQVYHQPAPIQVQRFQPAPIQVQQFQPTSFYGAPLQEAHHFQQPIQSYSAPIDTSFHQAAQQFLNTPAFREKLLFEAPVQSIEVSQSHSVETVPSVAPINVDHETVSIESLSRGAISQQTSHSGTQITGSNGGYVY